MLKRRPFPRLCAISFAQTSLRHGLEPTRRILGGGDARADPQWSAFALRALDMDNGNEFVIDRLIKFCLSRKIELTRSRPYRKNDQAWIEQKPGRRSKGLGYRRVEGLHLSLSGRSELSTSFYGAMYDYAHSNIAPQIQRNIRSELFAAGHMAYTDDRVRRNIAVDVSEFVEATDSSPDKGHMQSTERAISQ